MIKHMKIVLLLGTILLLLAACAAPTAQPTATATKEVVLTTTPIYVVITATPLPATATEKSTSTATNTATAVNTATPTVPGAYTKEGFAISSTSSIVITNIKDTHSGQALISWNASGTFAHGFRLYYSTSSKTPYLGAGFSEYEIADGTARSAYIEGTPGTTYYYRLCNYTGSACTFYSNSFGFTFAKSTP